jgi:hypothetical protein
VLQSIKKIDASVEKWGKSVKKVLNFDEKKALK